MKSIHAYLISFALLVTSLCASAQGDLNLNGMAAFEQLRKEYYIGALYLGWPGHDPAAIANMPGKKRMLINVTADRWPALRFAQMWNQAITINNPSATINANALDILAFTSLPKGDLVAGDRLVIELNDNATVVSLNGIPALRTSSAALFNMLLNGWIGPRPPTSEFKRDILELPKDQAASDLLARFEANHPNESRKKVIAGWGFKAEPEPAAVAATSVATVAATATAAAPTPKKPEVAEAKPESASKPAAEQKPAAEAKTATETKPVVAPPKAAVAETPKHAPAPPAQPPQPDAAALAAKAEHEKEQTALTNDYATVLR
ncbi:MAG TPA: chalcone isomerase family protein, partial [Spongiibacteraceae bacterium]|nr:chalcone isomerase family protein [Spongiibacteraceae bacterium]